MDRYSRNKLIEGFGEEGQEALSQASVLIVGAGGLGSPCLLYLASAGIGTLGIVEYDRVEPSNLQRQILYTEQQLNYPKVEMAKERLQALNSNIKIQTHPFALNATNSSTLFRPYDFIVDCSDNLETKYLINDTCVELEKPFSFGSVIGLQGQTLTYTPGNTSLRTLFGNLPHPDKQIRASQVGVLGAMAGLIGSIQATEVIKYLTGVGQLLVNRLLLVNGKDFSFQILRVD